jgi:hypothetical protein
LGRVRYGPCQKLCALNRPIRHSTNVHLYLYVPNRSSRHSARQPAPGSDQRATGRGKHWALARCGRLCRSGLRRPAAASQQGSWDLGRQGALGSPVLYVSAFDQLELSPSRISSREPGFGQRLCGGTSGRHACSLHKGGLKSRRLRTKEQSVVRSTSFCTSGFAPTPLVTVMEPRLERWWWGRRTAQERSSTTALRIVHSNQHLCPWGWERHARADETGCGTTTWVGDGAARFTATENRFASTTGVSIATNRRWYLAGSRPTASICTAAL